MNNLEEYIKHKQLLNEIKHLTWKIKGARSLSTHQVYTAQHNALINLLQKEKEGKLNLDDYDQYKGYMFMTIRSQINRQLEVLQYKYNKLTSSAHQLAEYEELSFDEWISVQGTPENVYQVHSLQIDITDKEIREKLKRFSPIDRAIIRWRARGWFFNEMADAIQKQGLGRNNIRLHYYKLVERLLN